MSAQKWDQAANLCSVIPFSPNPHLPTLTRPPPFPCSLAYLRSGGGGGDSNANEGDLNGDEVIGLTDMGNTHTHAPTRTQKAVLSG